MRPVPFPVFGFPVQSYGLSKGVAAVLAAFLLGRAFRRRGLKEDDALSIVLWATVWGSVGAKIYLLLEHADEITRHHVSGARSPGTAGSPAASDRSPRLAARNWSSSQVARAGSTRIRGWSPRANRPPKVRTSSSTDASSGRESLAQARKRSTVPRSAVVVMRTPPSAAVPDGCRCRRG